MAEPENIQAFNRLVLRILTDCYEVFPGRADFGALSLTRWLRGDPEEASDQVDYEYQRSADVADTIEMASETLLWLEAEGFARIRATTLGGGFHGVQLTHKGLTLLGLPSSVSDRSETIFEKAKQALEEGATGAVTETMKTLLAKASGAALLAIGAS